jgi:hypothetical protein
MTWRTFTKNHRLAAIGFAPLASAAPLLSTISLMGLFPYQPDGIVPGKLPRAGAVS